jgi:hypothetical protein
MQNNDFHSLVSYSFGQQYECFVLWKTFVYDRERASEAVLR